MSLPYTKKEISQALIALGLKKGDLVFSHSNVGFLGLPKGTASIDNVFHTILEGFLDVIGEEGTLIVPTFTYSFSQGQSFNPLLTPSNCGVFTEKLRQFANTCRSDDPNVSVAALGARALELTRDVPVNAYGPNSFFERFYHAQGLICNINFDAGSTFAHYVERRLKVPYRFDKTFTGTIIKNGVEERRESTIWVRHLTDGTAAYFENLDKLAREKKLYNTVKVGRGFIGVISAKAMFDLIKDTIIDRPWFLTEAETLNIIPEINCFSTDTLNA